jgi:hypothetical protein
MQLHHQVAPFVAYSFDQADSYESIGQHTARLPHSMVLASAANA